jgi:hypothetical protein
MVIKRLRKSWLGVMVWGLAMNVAVQGAPQIYPTGVTIYDPKKAHNSYVIFGSPDGKTHLIDMNGNEVKQWPYIGFPVNC